MRKIVLAIMMMNAGWTSAQELDMEVILYDDNDYPTGMAGGKLGELYPEHTMKRLDIIIHKYLLLM